MTNEKDIQKGVEHGLEKIKEEGGTVLHGFERILVYLISAGLIFIGKFTLETNSTLNLMQYRLSRVDIVLEEPRFTKADFLNNIHPYDKRVESNNANIERLDRRVDRIDERLIKLEGED